MKIMKNVFNKTVRLLTILFVVISCSLIGYSDSNKQVTCQSIAKTVKLPPNTKLSKNQRSSKGIDIQCEKGYFFRPGRTRAVILCKNGTILGRIRSCKGCNPPPSVQNGTVIFTKLSVGSKAKYTCDVGFTLNRRRQIRCGKRLKWSGQGNPICQQNKCLAPKKLRLVHGNVTIIDPSYHEFSTISFKCNDGYELIGDEEIICKDNRWSGRFPRCRRKQCLRPRSFKNGRVLGNSFYVGSTIQFKCNSDFTLYGSRRRTCQKDKTWNGTLAICDDGRYHCRDPGIPIGATKIGRNTYDIGAEVQYRCKSGYKIEGSEKRKCLNNKRWSGVQPRCVDVNYKVFPSVNETVEKFSENFVNSLLQTTCSGSNVSCPKADPRARKLQGKYKDGLDLIFMLDSSSSITEKNFEIAKSFIKEIIEIFGVDTRSPDGTQIACVTYKTTADVEFNFGDDSVKTKEKALQAIDKIKYTGGGTATRHALNMVRNVILPMGRSKTNSTTAVFLMTDGEANIGGRPKAAANSLKEINKLEIYVVGIGKIEMQALKDLASGKDNAEREEHVFEVKNFENLKRLKKWIKESKKVDYSQCGRAHYVSRDSRLRIVGGRQSERKDWPWMVKLSIKSIKNGRYQCGGTLINKEYILTAAHCFFDDFTKIRPWQVTAILSDTKKSVMIKTAMKFLVHQNFNQSTLANDIALLKIDELTRFQRHQQKICLPRNLKDQLPSKLMVLGWGGTKNKSKGMSATADELSKDLKQVELSSASAQDCAKNVKNKQKDGQNPNWYFNNATQICTAVITGKRDACTGDSGGPAMVLAKDENGKWRWFQVGIVSWGNGCAQKGEYSYFTKVSPFLDWMDKTMQEMSK